MSAEVDALLERLVAQFESPYDFLRELVQNAMDAGSDRVEVTLESHPADADGGDPDAVVFELTVLDTGAGMDEAIIDQELTRLFSSGKSGDRTMAGGFGVGFVSVFAWEPEAVLVHTGRGGESWELLFHGDRSFEKVAVDAPLEGTTITMLRRGRAAEREAIAEAVRDSLWRWCRFCPLELSFEDLDGDEPAELIQDSPEPPGAAHGLRGLSQTEQRGESTLRVSFAVPSNAVFLRRGLILAEGSPGALLSGARDKLGASVEHLQVWADSPLLRTSLARDKVLDDEGRHKVEERLLALIGSLREQLLTQLERTASVGEQQLELDEQRADPHWTRERHGTYAALHAHLALEHAQLGRKLAGRSILRDLVHGRAISLDAALRHSGLGGLLIAAPPELLGDAPIDTDEGTASSDRAGVEALLIALRPTELVVLAGQLGDDESWLRALAELAGDVELLPLERVFARVEPRPEDARGLCGLVATILQRLGCAELELELADFADHRGRPTASPLGGPQIVGAALPLASCAPQIPVLALTRCTYWINARHHLVEAALASYPERPLLTGLSVAAAILANVHPRPELAELTKLAERLEQESAAS